MLELKCTSNLIPRPEAIKEKYSGLGTSLVLTFYAPVLGRPSPATASGGGGGRDLGLPWCHTAPAEHHSPAWWDGC